MAAACTCRKCVGPKPIVTLHLPGDDVWQYRLQPKYARDRQPNRDEHRVLDLQWSCLHRKYRKGYSVWCNCRHCWAKWEPWPDWTCTEGAPCRYCQELAELLAPDVPPLDPWFEDTTGG